LSSSEPQVGRTALSLVPIALFSRGVAFLIPVAVALWFGVNHVTDAWYWALAFPTFALVLASSAVATAVTPAMANVRKQDPSRLPSLIGGLLFWTAVTSLLLGAAICSAGPWVLETYTDFGEETRGMAALFLWELLPFMVLTSTAAVLRAAVVVNGQFKHVAFTPMIRGTVVLLTTWVLLEPAGPHALPWGLVVGEFVQALWWGALLIRAGVGIRPSMNLDPTIQRVGKDLIPIFGGEVLMAFNLVVDKGFAALLNEGSVATLEFADRARIIPTTLLHSTLVMVGFATWSNLIARGDREQARHNMDQTLRWTLSIAGPMLAGMFIGRQVLIGLMFERGEFSPADTLQTASVLGWYIPGILPTLLGILAVRAHVVERNLRLILAVGIASVAMNFTLNQALVGPMGLHGLALSTTINLSLMSLVYVLCLLPVLPARVIHRWLPNLVVVAISIGLTLLWEFVIGTPSSIRDGSLWAGAAACTALLGVAGGIIRKERAR
jgi:putative peptidoglycan lipid II flippase